MRTSQQININDYIRKHGLFAEDFEILKTEASKIQELNTRMLFYVEYLTRYRQAQSKGDIEKQIFDEITLIEWTQKLTITTSQTQAEPNETNNDEAISLKVKCVLIAEILNTMKLGRANNDLTKICQLMAILTGNSYGKIYSQMKKGITFSDFHSKQIDKVNNILKDIKSSISIDLNRQY